MEEEKEEAKALVAVVQLRVRLLLVRHLHKPLTAVRSGGLGQRANFCPPGVVH